MVQDELVFILTKYVGNSVENCQVKNTTLKDVTETGNTYQ